MKRCLLPLIVLILCSCKGGGEGRQSLTATTTALEQTIDSMFGCRLELPQGMTYSHRGQGFIWVSDNEMPTMRNICLYTYPGIHLDAAESVRKRDSVMQLNIQGEEAGMYMHTESKVPVSQKFVTWKGRQLLRTEGLWEMEGDAMGGPFVSHSWADTLRGHIIVAEAFVFAPGRDKQQTMKRLEAQLLKIEIKQ